MINFIVGGIIVLLVGFALWQIHKAKKSGAHCIGCSSGSCNCGCNKSDSL